jgi:UDP-N-acetyl-D-mannosaminuronate dehydrogenase
MGLRLPPKIQDGSAIVGVIGLGYVGLPLMHAFHTRASA